MSPRSTAPIFLFLEVLSQAVNSLATFANKLEKFASHSALKTVNTSNTVANLYNSTYFTGLYTGVNNIELLAQRFVDRLCGDFSH